PMANDVRQRKLEQVVPVPPAADLAPQFIVRIACQGGCLAFIRLPWHNPTLIVRRKSKNPPVHDIEKRRRF
ncbi:MAG: hypothetical protein KAV87_04330, partial [Desulfobacteraceae bacterium]|nr:hypothetical protein [Desulfobacteraceae bacterium]